MISTTFRVWLCHTLDRPRPANERLCREANRRPPQPQPIGVIRIIKADPGPPGTTAEAQPRMHVSIKPPAVPTKAASAAEPATDLGTTGKKRPCASPPQDPRVKTWSKSSPQAFDCSQLIHNNNMNGHYPRNMHAWLMYSVVCHRLPPVLL